jgi:hypothetical protein
LWLEALCGRWRDGLFVRQVCAVIAKWEGLLGDPKQDTPAIETALGSGDADSASSANH